MAFISNRRNLNARLFSATAFIFLSLMFQNMSSSTRSSATVEDSITIFISADSAIAEEGNSGSIESSPVTLKEALKISRKKRAEFRAVNKEIKIEVVFLPGTYYAQSIVWDSFSDRYPTLFRPSTQKLGDVIFDGRLNSSERYGATKTALNFKLPENVKIGQATNVQIENLYFRYYLEGIAFSGITRDEPKLITSSSPSLAITKNSVINSKFEKIGSMWTIITDPKKPEKPQIGLAVIRLLNSSFNQIIKNQFFDINNAVYTKDLKPTLEPSGSGLHALYIAHSSSNNLIEGNTISNHNSGSVVKIRDSSNNNTIARNSFDNVTVPIQIWHCEVNKSGARFKNDVSATTEIDESDSDRCSKHPLYGQHDNKPQLNENYECLSYNTKAIQNIYGKKSNGTLFSESVSPFRIFKHTSYACNPESTDLNFQKETTIVNSGVIQATPGKEAKIYFGRCNQNTDCVNSSNTCFKTGSGSSHLICENNNWRDCNLAVVNSAKGNLAQLKSGSQVCKKTTNGQDALWTATPAGKYFVSSYSGNLWRYDFCRDPKACINSKNICFGHDTGTLRMWCEASAWKVCNAGTLGFQAGSKKCTKTQINGASDYIWK